ncbi:MAG: pectate lyase [Fibrobacterota bacterium]|nr:pectate lyase [Fibrobacterota bacterium]QQS06247.1 MAG: pectate lyase [Fibrobacterota bacterium]
MNRFRAVALLLLGTCAVAEAAKLLAFPTAVGFGRYTTGGRGGEVYHVTNLNDAGAGSLRDAVSKPGRVVVFDVSGIINLQSTLIFSGNSTIAGHTAPGDGIMLYGDRVSFSGASNLIIRHLRVRMGIGGTSGKDAAGVANGSDMVFDHMSVNWGRDETFSISWDSKGTEPGNITIQNSIIGQGLETHSCGGLVQTDGGVTLFGNLYIDNKTRNPKVKGLNQFVNNVVYNWGGGGGYIMGGSAGDSWAVIENNYFIKGPSTGGTAAFVRSTETFQVYQKNNLLDYDLNGALNGTPAAVSIFDGATLASSYSGFTNAPQAHPVIEKQTSAEEAYQIIVKSVGASKPARDEVDKYIVAELTSLGKKGALIADEAALGLSGKVGGLAKGTAPTDSDKDGMPDAWETSHGLKANDATDRNGTNLSLDGYTNLEMYLNELAGDPVVYKTAGATRRGLEGAAEARVTWMDPSGKVIAVEGQWLDRTAPSPAKPTGLRGVAIASVRFEGQAPRILRTMVAVP